MLNLEGVTILLDHEAPISKEIIRNSKVILTTFEGEVPYDRSFGLTSELLDLPITEARDLYTVECITKLRRYEPRASVIDISFIVDDNTGKLCPKVVLSYESE
ncbi:MAG: hypothetical protein ABS938_00245 [Psychrobacillus psychrodurans]